MRASVINTYYYSSFDHSIKKLRSSAEKITRQHKKNHIQPKKWSGQNNFWPKSGPAMAGPAVPPTTALHLHAVCFWRGHSLCRAPLTTGVDIYPRVLPSAYCVLLAHTHTHTHTHWTLPTTMSVLETPLQGTLNHWGRILPQGPTIQNNQLKKECV